MCEPPSSGRIIHMTIVAAHLKEKTEIAAKRKTSEHNDLTKNIPLSYQEIEELLNC